MMGKPHLGPRPRGPGTVAFSLVEVVLAMGIISFALIILLGLVPVGMKSNIDSMGESQAVNLMQALIADRQATAFSANSSVYNLPALTNVTAPITGTIYVNEDAVTTNAQPAAALYRVTYTVDPSTTVYANATNFPAAGPPMPVLVNFRVSWPAAQTNQTSEVESVATFMQQ
jgi:uncharacterized protein (TIGR02598 family)